MNVQVPPDTKAVDCTLVHALQARLQADTGLPVGLKETHISWILLTEQRAYKLKKPVRLPFLDFSTPASRQHFCEEELRLNQRLAPSPSVNGRLRRRRCLAVLPSPALCRRGA